MHLYAAARHVDTARRQVCRVIDLKFSDDTKLRL